jgi:hypothetical protein
MCPPPLPLSRVGKARRIRTGKVLLVIRIGPMLKAWMTYLSHLLLRSLHRKCAMMSNSFAIVNLLKQPPMEPSTPTPDLWSAMKLDPEPLFEGATVVARYRSVGHVLPALSYAHTFIVFIAMKLWMTENSLSGLETE